MKKTVLEQCFEAVLTQGDRALGWTIVPVPFDPKDVWPEMVRLRVAGEIAGPRGKASFRTSLFPQPDRGVKERFHLLVTRSVQKQTGAQCGTEVEVRLWPDLDERPAELPEELDALLDEAEGLRAWYGTLSEYKRREIGKWIGGAKGDAGRARRAEQMAERLLQVMEAEVELPPILQTAFRASAKARKGWERTSVTHRRAELMALFSYQSVESRAKRLLKLIEAAEKRAS